YLGRWNNEYFSSRMVLGAIPGLELVEMNRNMYNALCCGGGGGNFFTDMLGPGPDSSSRVRVKAACETGADIIAVACPQCFKMLDDARKAEGLDEIIKIMDLSQIVNASWK
ncbi:MAG: (Fe-S)-binding protein, partial [Deltaproteobacteria bacterium]|nr:(Fe-S)-binding protein [Deltaproteobacteria bacterium]